MPAGAVATQGFLFPCARCVRELSKIFCPSPYLPRRFPSGFWVLCVALEDRIDLNLLRIQALQREERREEG